MSTTLSIRVYCVRVFNRVLLDHVQKNVRPIQKLVKYMIDVSMGMHYLSERGLVHRVSTLVLSPATVY